MEHKKALCKKHGIARWQAYISDKYMPSTETGSQKVTIMDVFHVVKFKYEHEKTSNWKQHNICGVFFTI